MIRTGQCFAYEIPDGWSESRDGPRFVYHGPRGEEVIVSGAVVFGPGERGRSDVRERLIENAKESARNAASHPDLVIKRALTPMANHPACDCWVLHAETSDGTVYFGEAVLVAATGVLLVTIEAENTEDVRRRLESIIASIRPVGP